MDNKAIYNELLSIEASAKVLAERAERLRLKLPGSQMQGKQQNRGGLSEAAKANLLVKRHKRLKLVK